MMWLLRCVIDLETGFVLKVGSKGEILRAFDGERKLTKVEIQ